MQHAGRIPYLILAAALSLAATGASAADAQPTPAAPIAAISQPAQEDELEEVFVRGKRLADVIEDAEDEFFDLYNKLNRDHNYDVHCGYMQLDRGSLAMTRTCVPGFIVYNHYDLAGQPVRQCSSTSTPEITGTAPNYGSGTAAYYYAGCTWAPLPPVELLAMEHRLKYEKNVLRVIGSDARLLSMAGKLAGLYNEMSTVQNRYVSIKGPGQPVRSRERPARSVKAATGPRAL
jgi:hypothetical protein